MDFQEDDQHEFKAWTFSSKFDWLISELECYVCAFSNTNGGTVYIGINDEGEVQGTMLDHALGERVQVAVDKIVLKTRIIRVCNIEEACQASIDSTFATPANF